jgi:uncharacterized protein
MSASWNTLWYVLSALLVLIGLLGTILPVLPGVPIVFAGFFLAAWTDGFHHVGPFTLTILGLLTALAVALDFVATAFGAKRVGASGWALTGAAIGTIVGMFFFLPGLILGPFIGAVMGELVVNSDLKKASKAGFGAWLGLLLGTVAKIAVCFVMIGVFTFAYFV